MPESKPLRSVKRFNRIVTFRDLSLNRKFTLFALGVLFWLGALTVVAFLALASIERTHNRIVHQTLPHELITHHISRNLQGVALEAERLRSAADAAQVARHHDQAQTYLKDIDGFITTLVLGGKTAELDPASRRALEGFAFSPIHSSAEGMAFLRALSPLVTEIGQSLKAVSVAQTHHLQARTEVSAAPYRQLAALLEQANQLSNDYTSSLIAQHQRSTTAIAATIHYTGLAMLLVLLVAVVLLGLFTRWIAVAIARPISSIIEQVRSFSAGELDLSRKFTIDAQDEIGTLAAEFNDLIETVCGMTTFKSIIEEDASLLDIYVRLGNVFQDIAGIEDYCIYEIREAQQTMAAVYPQGLDEATLRCKPEILGHCELCRARQTGHQVSSLDFPGVCLQFRPDFADQQHVCLPLTIGGRIGGVVQFLFRPAQDEPLSPQTVQPRLFKAEAYLKQSQSVIEAKQLLLTLRESALRDALTGLYNRRFLQDHAQQIIAGVQRREKPLGLLMCDLDFFKQVNDKYGHEIGDLLLRETATSLSCAVRESDYVIRFGGEEFLILLLDVEEADLLQIAEKIRAAVAATSVRIPAGSLSRTVSIGISAYPGDSETFWKAIRYADVALYQAKKDGRNRVVRFSSHLWDGDPI